MATEASSRVSSAAGNGKQGHSLISEAKFRQLYGLVLRLQGKCGGREAALAAVTADLRDDDELVADSAGGTGFTERAIAAMGGAATDRMRGNGRVTVLFAPGSGADAMLRKAWALASAAKLAVLFVEETAGGGNRRRHAGDEPDENQLPAIPVDAQDVVALYRVAHESIARAREGSGPTRIVCMAWPSGNGKAEGAVEPLERWLESRGLPAQAWRHEVEAELQKNPEPRLAAAFTKAAGRAGERFARGQNRQD